LQQRLQVALETVISMWESHGRGATQDIYPDVIWFSFGAKGVVERSNIELGWIKLMREGRILLVEVFTIDANF
jgi:hypothetical protein